MPDFINTLGQIGGVAGDILSSFVNPVGGIINAVGRLFGNSEKQQYGNQKALMQQQQKYNLALMEQQQAYNLANWEREAAYKTPANQRKLLEEAGYNINSLDGSLMGVGSMSPSTISSGGTPTAPMPVDSIQFSQIAEANSRIDLNEANADVAKAEAEEIRNRTQSPNTYFQYWDSMIQNLDAKTQNEFVNNRILELKADMAKDSYGLTLRELETRVDNLVENTAVLRSQGELNTAQTKAALANAVYTHWLSALTEKNISLTEDRRAVLQAMANKYIQDAKVGVEQEKLTRKQAKVVFWKTINDSIHAISDLGRTIDGWFGDDPVAGSTNLVSGDKSLDLGKAVEIGSWLSGLKL